MVGVNVTTPPPPALSGLSIGKTDQLTDKLIAQIEEVIWGYKTGVRYRIFDRREMLGRLVPPGFFLLLQQHDEVIGTLFSLPKRISNGQGELFEGLYVSVLSVLPREHGKGHAQNLIRAAYMEAPVRGLEYAYIEDLNVPSAAAFKAQGYAPIGQFHAMTFNRLRPQSSPRVRALPLDRSEEVCKRLVDLYHDHAFADIDQSFQPHQYWVLEEGGEILAGAQIEEERWSIESMPGPEGRFAVDVLPYLPLLNRILNPRRIPVLKIGNLYVPAGRETEFMELVAHLTKHYQKKLALGYLDKRSPIYQRLKKSLWFGIFNPLFETPVNVWARFTGLTDREISELKARPYVISPLDIS